MKDFPMFTTEDGIASLKLREIPYTKSAYITIRDALDPAALLDACISFCKAVGAEHIYATGHSILNQYAVYARIIKMGCMKENILKTDVAVFPVTEETIDQWREIYNDKMKNVPMAAYMTATDGKELLLAKKGYFIHNNGELLGIGAIDGDNLEVIASVKQGTGEEILKAICDICCDEMVYLSSALENEKAMDLYNRCGFIMQEELQTWYCVT